MNKDNNINEKPLPSQNMEPLTAPEQDAKKFVSFGRRVHNEVTYRGVDWLVNSALAVSFA